MFFSPIRSPKLKSDLLHGRGTSLSEVPLLSRYSRVESSGGPFHQN
jgi:hypothetical protein